MMRTMFLAAASLVCVLGVSAQQHAIDTQKSTLTIHVGKTGAFSSLGHEHEVRAPIHSGTADTGSHPAVEIHVDARALRVIDKDESEKDRVEVQKTMLGSEVLDSERHQEIVFKSTGAEPAGQGRWRLRGNLTLREQTRPVTDCVHHQPIQGTVGDGNPSSRRHQEALRVSPDLPNGAVQLKRVDGSFEVIPIVRQPLPRNGGTGLLLI